MTALRHVVVETTLDKVKIVFINRETAKWWNQRRAKDDTVQFCGWYWVRGNDEAGPFRSKSACIRDAYYRFVLKRDMPHVGAHAAYPPTVTRGFRRIA